MLIVSKIQRTGGSRITVDGADYIFKPEKPNGPHLCDVTNKAHVERLLDIPEGFEAFDKADAPAPAPDAQERLEQAMEPAGNPDLDEGKDPDPEAELEAAIESDQSDGLEDMDDPDLHQWYRDLFDKAPHHKMLRATIIQHIRNAMAETAQN